MDNILNPISVLDDRPNFRRFSIDTADARLDCISLKRMSRAVRNKEHILPT